MKSGLSFSSLTPRSNLEIKEVYLMSTSQEFNRFPDRCGKDAPKVPSSQGCQMLSNEARSEMMISRRYRKKSEGIT